ncbi:hypothetical protein PPL_08887 [Heterostelium album PN500]|uniref:UDP-N-acetylglucosamine--dolichyl-phosphate N-acetylglucosaminephosphotransferase n=1 Tax=Heterostelium pallidum (strain ATCC 26659 / Pp 5 / PN500) TaxID=670386 RepID=D3BK06_HETP5|nr:hypothetical protein PPL_08887 [Heterostelium album PN500]EFA78236.1 hypothetical protein PPL_08887 [Heterostelium album PN500]|eukprot:XP_020430361.1 hypothetical protein PPL_08887 [Heterostelium album PN500]
MDKGLLVFILSCVIPPTLYMTTLPSLSLQWIIVQLSILSIGAGVLTYRLIPSVAELTSTAGLAGMDLNKKGDAKYSGKKIPESLGIATSVVFLVCVILFQLFQWFSFPEAIQLSEFNAALTSICFMILLGFSDDVLNLRWRYKLILPLFASLPLLVAYAGGTSVVVPDINYPINLRAFLGQVVDLGIFYRIYLLMLAIFCTNSINILAGINGLEVGQSAVIATAIIIHNLVELKLHYSSSVASGVLNATLLPTSPHLLSLVLMVPFLFTTFALLMYNWYPSRVFVGDTYTYFAGIVPQLFGLIPCPRHRVPRFNASTGKMEAIPTNLTIINLCLMIFGPMTEKRLCLTLLAFQGLCCAAGFGIRYFVAPYFF